MVLPSYVHHRSGLVRPDTVGRTPFPGQMVKEIGLKEKLQRTFFLCSSFLRSRTFNISVTWMVRASAKSVTSWDVNSIESMMSL